MKGVKDDTYTAKLLSTTGLIPSELEMNNVGSFDFDDVEESGK